MIQVRLVGKTKHGKERVQRFGSIWNVLFSSEHRMLLRPANGSDDLRWVNIPSDLNFEIHET